MRHDKVWFEFYGCLQCISEDYYRKNPRLFYVSTEEGDDGCLYDIVENDRTNKNYCVEIGK